MEQGTLASPMREERRVVTALFADIVGSTAITERLDPEDARDVLGGAVALMVEQVDALGGTVKDLAGDGVLALFGAPVAHEDDAERAVLCGLRVIDAVAGYARRTAEPLGVHGFGVRVGIETGRAVLGPVGAGSRVEYGATGDALNTAARLQAQAEPGTVLVGEITRRMIEGRFSWGAVRVLELKGKDAPVEAAPALAHAPRPHSSTTLGEAPLVGREAELSRILPALDALSTGQGRVLVLIGDPGVGKSRLVAETRAAFETQTGGTWLEGATASYGGSTPYLPFRHLLLGWLGLPFDARPEDVRAALAPHIADLHLRADARDLETAITGTGSTDGRDPEALQESAFRAVRVLLDDLAAEGAIAVVLEDLHWSDPTSLSLTEYLASTVTDRPIFLLLTMRPEPTCEEVARRIEVTLPDQVEILRLGPLTREADRRLMRALVGGADLPHALEERLLDSTDGNPFFAEEQIRALVDGGALELVGQRWRFVENGRVEIAPTVERALIARIDRLSEEHRTTLLAASVLGSSFDAPLVSTLTGADAGRALEELDRTGFLLRRASHDHDSGYRFRHALVQEAAYGNLLRRHRRELHGRAATALEAAYAGHEDDIAATLGRHLAEAGETDRATSYLATAARRAAAAFANEEAAALSASALVLLPGEPGAMTAAQRTTARELSTVRGVALRFLARYREAVEAYRTALALTPPEEPLEAAQTHSIIGQILVDAHAYEEALAELDAADAAIDGRTEGDEGFAVWLDVQLSRCTVYYWLADVARYSETLARAEPLVETRATPQQRIDFYGSVRAVMWRRDRYVVSDELLRLDRTLYEAERESKNEESRGWAIFMHALTVMWHGDLDEAEPLLTESLALADRIDATLLRSRALTYLMVTARLRGDVDRASSLIEPVLDAAREGALPEYEAMAAATAAWVAFRRSDLPSVSREGGRALETWAALPNRYPFDWMAALPLVGAALARDDPSDAAAWAAWMLEEHQQPLPESLTALLRGGVEAAAIGDLDGTARLLHEALRVASAHGHM